MDVQRAQEIVNSPAMHHVHYRGIPVYIQKIHTQQATASVFPLDNMDHEQLVDINGLHE